MISDSNLYRGQCYICGIPVFSPREQYDNLAPSVCVHTSPYRTYILCPKCESDLEAWMKSKQMGLLFGKLEHVTREKSTPLNEVALAKDK